MTLFRYLTREFIPPFIFSLSLIVFLFVLNLVFTMLGRIVGKGLPVMTVVEFFALNLAWMIALAVPMAVLVAVLSAYGRLSSDNEVTALRSSGVGPWQMLLPAILFGLISAVGLAYFNNNVLPDLNYRSRQLQTDIKRLKPAMILEPGVFLSDIPGHVLYAQKVDNETSEIHNVVVYEDDDPRFGGTVIADRGKLKYEEWFEGFEFTLNDGEILRSDRARPGEHHRIAFQSAIFRIHAPDMSLRRTSTDWRGDREMDVTQLMQRIENYKSNDANKNAKNISRLWVEIHKKFSIPAACLIFAALGGLLGQMVRRSGIGVSAGYSMAFFLIYWVFLIAGEDLADRGTVTPASAMWAPNVLFALVALYLWWRQRRSGQGLFG
ncbi:MAG: LptF/LptG family permease [bacterium]|nr:LptF/LptG family permease [bacterium]